MNLNSLVDVEAIRERARVLVTFAVEICWLQLHGRRHFRRTMVLGMVDGAFCVRENGNYNVNSTISFL